MLTWDMKEGRGQELTHFKGKRVCGRFLFCSFSIVVV